MGKTYKKYTRGRFFRSMRGHKQARINNARYGATPPDPWDDRPMDDHCFVPSKVARTMFLAGYPEYYVIERIQKKFNLTYLDAYEITGSDYRPDMQSRRWAYILRKGLVSPVPDGAIKVWRTSVLKVNKYK